MAHRWFAASLLIAALFLTGCILVPAGPYWGHGYRHHHGYHHGYGQYRPQPPGYYYP